jgi:hypothetical protein
MRKKATMWGPDSISRAWVWHTKGVLMGARVPLTPRLAVIPVSVSVRSPRAKAPEPTL